MPDILVRFQSVTSFRVACCFGATIPYTFFTLTNLQVSHYDQPSCGSHRPTKCAALGKTLAQWKMSKIRNMCFCSNIFTLLLNYEYSVTTFNSLPNTKEMLYPSLCFSTLVNFCYLCKVKSDIRPMKTQLYPTRTLNPNIVMELNLSLRLNW